MTPARVQYNKTTQRAYKEIRQTTTATANIYPTGVGNLLRSSCRSVAPAMHHKRHSFPIFWRSC